MKENRECWGRTGQVTALNRLIKEMRVEQRLEKCGKPFSGYQGQERGVKRIPRVVPDGRCFQNIKRPK